MAVFPGAASAVGAANRRAVGRATLSRRVGLQLYTVNGDKGYCSNDLRAWLAQRGTRAVIPSKRNHKTQVECDPTIYKQRNIIERMFCRFKDWCRVATRFNRNVKTFMATIAIAATVIGWL